MNRQESPDYSIWSVRQGRREVYASPWTDQCSSKFLVRTEILPEVRGCLRRLDTHLSPYLFTDPSLFRLVVRHDPLQLELVHCRLDSPFWFRCRGDRLCRSQGGSYRSRSIQMEI